MYTDGQIIFNQNDVVPPGETSTVRARVMRSLDAVLFVEVQYKPTDAWAAKPANWLLGSGYQGSIEGLAGQDIFDRYQISQGESVQGKRFNIAPGTYQNGVVVGASAGTPGASPIATSTPVKLPVTNPVAVKKLKTEDVGGPIVRTLSLLIIPVGLWLMTRLRVRSVAFWVIFAVVFVDCLLLLLGFSLLQKPKTLARFVQGENFNPLFS